MKQYYEQQSGGSYTIEGTVLGWYTAQNTAVYYGEDSDTSHNINAKEFVYESLVSAAQQQGVDLTQYYQEDPYDVDTDGDINEIGE
jgi:immune inhibitor A